MIWISVLLGAAASAQFSAAVPQNVNEWLVADDVTVPMLQAEGQWPVRIALTVSPEGKVEDCSIVSSGGNQSVDRYTCKLASRRARFTPAKDAQGNPTYGVFRTTLTWWVGQRPPVPAAPFKGEFDLTVNKLPDGVASPAILSVAFPVDASGTPQACAGERPEDSAALVSVACDQVLKTYRPAPAKSAAGEVVISIQEAEFRFTAG